MDTNKDNPTFTLLLTKKQKRKIRDWTGCDVSSAIVSAYPREAYGQLKDTVSLQLEAEQIRDIKECFSSHYLTGKEIVVFDVSAEDTLRGRAKAVAVAVLQKEVGTLPLPQDTREPYYDNTPTCSCSDDR